MLEFAKELARCAADPWYWMTTYVRVSNPDPTKGTIRFLPWEHLRQLLYIIQTNNRTAVLKARQIGVTWLLASIALHSALFIPNANVIIFSKRQVESVAMKERAKFIWRYLPEWMQQPIGKDNDELLTFPTMESKIQSFPATPGAGRSETATIAIIDEWAYIEYAQEIYTGVLPTVETTKFVGVSTANGRGGVGKHFADIYWGAKSGENSFIPVFIPYHVVPGRGEEWWERQKQDMPLYLALQEYPKFEADAFVVAGTCMFDIPALRAMPVFSVTATDFPEIYVPYNPDHTYSASVDTALGVTGGDYNVIQILDCDTGDQAAKFRSRLPVEQFNEVAYGLLLQYGSPSVIVEEQPIGRLLVKLLTDNHYPPHRIYHRTKGVPCWHTTEPNRRQILQELEIGIRTQIKIHSPITVEECLSFGYNETKNKFVGLSGHDDEVMSLALAWHQATYKPTPLSESSLQPKSYLSLSNMDWEDVDWHKSDPFAGLSQIKCPTCDGERWLALPTGSHEICDACGGVGYMVVKNAI